MNRPVQALHRPHDDDRHGCADVPQLRRLQYFFGQMLGVNDFRTEQDYFREKLKLHNRCFHGYGTVCGLLVKPAPQPADCDTEEDKKEAERTQQIRDLRRRLSQAEGAEADAIRERIAALEAESAQTKSTCAKQPIRPTVLVECGIALDCLGNEIVVRRTETVDLWSRLTRAEQAKLDEYERTLYLTVCFCEKPVDPVRPIGTDSCEPRADCVYGKVQDSYYFDVSLTPPPADRRCDSCCEPCKHACLLLAVIHDVAPDRALTARQVDNSDRRLLTRYEANRIVGINWTHGAEYTYEDVDALLGTADYHESGGLILQIEQPVNVQSVLARGVIDLWVVEGGKGKHGAVYSLDIEVEAQDEHDGYGRRFRVRYTGDDRLDNGDRVIVTVRGAFILDRCCRPLDGVHVGGMVPLIPDDKYKRFDRSGGPLCVRDPYGPPASGYAPGGATTFESWFFVERDGAQKTSKNVRRQGY